MQRERLRVRLVPMGSQWTKLSQALDEAERHIAAAAEDIGTQQQIIRKYESSRRGASGAAKTAGKVLASMERAQQGASVNRSGDRPRIKRRALAWISCGARARNFQPTRNSSNQLRPAAQAGFFYAGC
jgi:hypothetical protein